MKSSTIFKYCFALDKLVEVKVSLFFSKKGEKIFLPLQIKLHFFLQKVGSVDFCNHFSFSEMFLAPPTITTNLN